jgi:hypothetical protein
LYESKSPACAMRGIKPLPSGEVQEPTSATLCRSALAREYGG